MGYEGNSRQSTTGAVGAYIGGQFFAEGGADFEPRTDDPSYQDVLNKYESGDITAFELAERALFILADKMQAQELADNPEFASSHPDILRAVLEGDAAKGLFMNGFNTGGEQYPAKRGESVNTIVAARMRERFGQGFLNHQLLLTKKGQSPMAQLKVAALQKRFDAAGLSTHEVDVLLLDMLAVNAMFEMRTAVTTRLSWKSRFILEDEAARIAFWTRLAVPYSIYRGVAKKYLQRVEEESVVVWGDKATQKLAIMRAAIYMRVITHANGAEKSAKTRYDLIETVGRLLVADDLAGASRALMDVMDEYPLLFSGRAKKNFEEALAVFREQEDYPEVVRARRKRTGPEKFIDRQAAAQAEHDANWAEIQQYEKMAFRRVLPASPKRPEMETWGYVRKIFQMVTVTSDGIRTIAPFMEIVYVADGHARAVPRKAAATFLQEVADGTVWGFCSADEAGIQDKYRS